MAYCISNARVLTDNGDIETMDLYLDGELISTEPVADARRLDAGGCLLLPGIVDIHGDAFERQIMPRPGVHFRMDAALIETDRQMVSNGITTAFHGVTCSWEPGLRSVEQFRIFTRALAEAEAHLQCDTRLHLRLETFNLDVEQEVADWLRAGRIDLLAFNDHTPDIFEHRFDETKSRKYADRTGLDLHAFRELVEGVMARQGEVPGMIERLAGIARELDIPMLSHDDDSPELRERFHRMGCRIAEFPTNEPTARHARELGDPIVMGAPNVMRGGSHNGAVCATDMVRKGLCQILATDYYYPAPLHAAFKLHREQDMSLADSWALVSRNPAVAAGMNSRGLIASGMRGDLVIVDDRLGDLPQVAATFVAGRPVYLGRADLLDQAA